MENGKYSLPFQNHLWKHHSIDSEMIKNNNNNHTNTTATPHSFSCVNIFIPYRVHILYSIFVFFYPTRGAFLWNSSVAFFCFVDVLSHRTHTDDTRATIICPQGFSEFREVCPPPSARLSACIDHASWICK